MEGLMMGTRCGSIDPGIILHLLKSEKLDAEKFTPRSWKKCSIKSQDCLP